MTAPGFEESWLAWLQIQRYHGQPHGAFGADEHLAGWGCGMALFHAACEIDLLDLICILRPDVYFFRPLLSLECSRVISVICFMLDRCLYWILLENSMLRQKGLKCESHLEYSITSCSIHVGFCFNVRSCKRMLDFRAFSI